jgi:HD-GYP domain-containing protein (c-di-GMP phosphodiesterase class II)
MRKLKVNELRPGMVFDKAVYIDASNILVAPMVALKSEDIDRLKKWGIEEVETGGTLLDEGAEVRTEDLSINEEINRLTKILEGGESVEQGPVEKTIEDIYNDTMRLVEDIFENVRNGVGYDKRKILNAVEVLIIEVSKDKNNSLREVTKEHEGKYIYSLGVNVAILSIVTGMTLGYGRERLVTLATAALLHDIGMVRVPNYITDKQGPLTPDEYNRIKTHPIYGYRIIIKELDLGNDIASVILQHHETYDGGGYPRKLRRDEISDYAKIVSICDVFLAMTKKRSYRDEHLSYHAMKSILGGSSRKFDPIIVKAFLANMAIYPVGSIVQLNNGVIARVISANSKLPLRPTVTVVIDEFGDKIEAEKIIDLQRTPSLFITNPLSKSHLKKLLNEQ